MSDNDLIRRGDALAAVQGLEYSCNAEEDISALPAVTVRAEDVSYLMRFADGEPHGTGTHDITAPEDRLYLAGYLETVNHRGRRLTEKGHALVARILAALEPVAAPDHAAIREAALFEAWNAVWEAKSLLDAKNALHALLQKGAANDQRQ